ncbi:MAG: hypothetical protein Q9160_009210 [Pyrenula sp. 1 TL-2023]
MEFGLSLQFSFVASIAFLGLVVFRKLSTQNVYHCLPPGPRPLPVVGNILDLPPKGTPEFQHWFKHKDLYGPITSITVMGSPMVIFHDKEAAYDVMGKKAQKTSARPQLNLAALCGFGNFLITHQYDDKYRKHRKMVHQEIGTKGLSAGFQPIQEGEALRFILQTFNDPDKMMVYLKTLAAAIILRILYGYSIERAGNDPLVGLIEHAMDNLSQAFVPLSWTVDAVPAIKYLPDWFPGTSYRKTAAEMKAVNEAAAELPYCFVKRQLALKTHRPSYVSDLLQQNITENGNNVNLAPVDEEAIKWTAVSLYAAGSDNRKNLPYVDAIVKEAWRWYPVGPMGLTHKAEEDLVCGEYVIPKGSYLLPSLWWFLHDPKDYSDPDVFKPERYLAPLNELDPSDLAFGYGRRSCAGRFFADASVYITVVQMLAVFKFSKAKDAQGNEIPVKLEAVAGMVNRPKPYGFKIEPRSPHHADLLRRIEAEQEPVMEDARLLDLIAV